MQRSAPVAEAGDVLCDQPDGNIRQVVKPTAAISLCSGADQAHDARVGAMGTARLPGTSPPGFAVCGVRPESVRLLTVPHSASGVLAVTI